MNTAPAGVAFYPHTIYNQKFLRQNGTMQKRSENEAADNNLIGSEASGQKATQPQRPGLLPDFFPEYILGLHEHLGGEQIMLHVDRRG